MILHADLLGLLRDAKLNPDDLRPRQILADWLEEHGQPERAEFVRLQLVEPEDRERTHAIWWPRREVWGAGVARQGVGVHPQRGLFHVYGQTERVLASAARRGATRQTWAWVESVEISIFVPADLKRMGRLSAFHHLGGLRLKSQSGLSDAIVPRADWGRTVGDWSALARLPTLPHLCDLRIEHDDLGADGVALLAAGAPGNLRSLHLRGCNLDDRGLACLGDMPPLPHLSELDLTQCRFGAPGLAALAHWPGLASVQTLRIGANYPRAEGAAALARSPHRAALRTLDLSNAPFGGDPPREGQFLGDAGLEALLDASPYAQLRTLLLSSHQLSPRAGEILASANFAKLTHLDLSFNPIGDAGLRALLCAPWLSRVQVLNLRYTEIGAEGATALLESPPLENITHLELWANNSIPGPLREALRVRFGERVLLPA